MMKLLTSFWGVLCLVVAMGAHTAHSKDILPIAQKAARNLDKQYKVGGMIGLHESVKQCYLRADELKTKDAVAYCVMLDFLVADLAQGAQLGFGYPIAPEFSFSNMNARAHKSFDTLGLDEAQRGILTAEWSRAAILAFASLTK